jgi:hypothetical protein
MERARPARDRQRRTIYRALSLLAPKLLLFSSLLFSSLLFSSLLRHITRSPTSPRRCCHQRHPHRPTHPIPIERATSTPLSRGFLPWRLSDDSLGANRNIPMARHPKPFTHADIRDVARALSKARTRRVARNNALTKEPESRSNLCHGGRVLKRFAFTLLVGITSAGCLLHDAVKQVYAGRAAAR